MPDPAHEAVLDRILDSAGRVTGARFAALAFLNAEGTEFDGTRTIGLDPASRLQFGDLTGDRGVLRLLPDLPQPPGQRVASLPPSRGASPAGPACFLSVPIAIHGEMRGALFLSDRADGEFGEAERDSAAVVAGWAGTAIELAGLYEKSARRCADLERAVRRLESIRDVAIAIGGEPGFDRVLDLIARRGRALIDADSVIVMLREGPDLVVVASAGDVVRMHRMRLPISRAKSGYTFEHGSPVRMADLPANVRLAAEKLGVPDAHSGLLVPMVHRGKTLGVLGAFDVGEDAAAFTVEDEEMLGMFAAVAAPAVSMAQSVESDRLRSSLAAADAERGHWARELHDETLQGLAALQILLSVAPAVGDHQTQVEANGRATRQVEHEIENLRAIIADLRPASLDELGLRAALDALLHRRREGDCEIVSDLRLPDTEAGEVGLAADLETAVYRLVQEALTNVTKHARARVVTVTVIAAAGGVRVGVDDDGVGFDAEAESSGFGLVGMRERVRLAGGTFTIASDGHGTRLEARLGGHPGEASAGPRRAA